jgi:hypothetical protein
MKKRGALARLWQSEIDARSMIRTATVYGNEEHAALASLEAGASPEVVEEALGLREARPSQTVILVDGRLAKHFEKGISPMSLPEHEARAILGDELYEDLKEAERHSFSSVITVTAIDGKRGSITFKGNG